MDAHFQGVWRMDWGLDNPNKTATLIATLMAAVWALLYFRRVGFWASLVLFIGLGLCLAQTVSRGGFISACGGLIILAWSATRPWPKGKVIALAIGTIIIIGYSVYLKTYTRYGQGIVENDPSITNRLVIWRVAPSMMVDSPQGWGLGNAGHSYLQWFQPVDRHQVYRTLVNSHLTWLVELGWPLRFLYIFAWLSIFMLCWPLKKSPLSTIPLAIWVSFFLGGIFSSVAESLWTWLVPCIALVAVLQIRWKAKNWPDYGKWIRTAIAAASILATLFVYGELTKGDIIHGSKDEVTIGGDRPRIWIVTDPHVLGADFGRTLRRYISSPSVGFVISTDIPTNLSGDTIVICGSPTKDELGKLEATVGAFRRVIVLNPTFYPQEIKFTNRIEVLGFFGEFAKTPSMDEWRNQFKDQISILTGTGDFVPKWPDLLLPHK